jgi:hypothetical protein
MNSAKSSSTETTRIRSGNSSRRAASNAAPCASVMTTLAPAVHSRCRRASGPKSLNSGMLIAPILRTAIWAAAVSTRCGSSTPIRSPCPASDDSALASWFDKARSCAKLVIWPVCPSIIAGASGVCFATLSQQSIPILKRSGISQRNALRVCSMVGCRVSMAYYHAARAARSRSIAALSTSPVKGGCGRRATMSCGSLRPLRKRSGVCLNCGYRYQLVPDRTLPKARAMSGCRQLLPCAALRSRP